MGLESRSNVNHTTTINMTIYITSKYVYTIGNDKMRYFKITIGRVTYWVDLPRL